MRVQHVLLLLTFAGCSTDHYPSRPGGFGPPGGGPDPTDAGGSDVDSGGTPVDGGLVDASVTGDGPLRSVTGTVCRIEDLRDPTACIEQPAGVGIQVLGSDISAVSTDGGAFELLLDGSVANVTVHLVVGFESADYHLSLVSITVDDTGATGVSATAVLETTFSDLTAALGVAQPDGTGTIALHLEEAGAPAVGSIIEPPAGSLEAPRYDTGDPLDWQPDTGTSDAGAVLVFGVAEASDAVINVAGLQGGILTIVGIQVVGNTLTFVRATVPPPT